MSDRTVASTSASARPPEGRALSTPSTQRLNNRPLKQVTNLETLMQNVEFRTRIAESLPRHMTPDRMLRTCMMAVQKAPLLAKADMRTLIGAFLTCSATGLEPNTPLGHAHLIPFKRTKYNPQTRRREEAGIEVQLIFGYPGLLELSYRSPLISSIQAHVAFDGDVFEYEYGTDAHLRHIPKGGAQAQGRRPIAAYMTAKLKDGMAFEVMPWADVLAIRNNSQAFRLALTMKEEAESKGYKLPHAWTEAPWVKHEVPMARKTAFRSGSKWLPRSVELASVISIDEAQERRRNIDWGSVIDAEEGDYLGAATVAADNQPEDEEGDQQQDQQPQQDQQRDERRPTEEDRGSGVFGGTAFGDGGAGGDPGPQPRGSEGGTKPLEGGQEGAGASAGAAAPESKPRGRPAKPKPDALPAFDAVVLDAYGDPLDGQVHDKRLSWANGYATAWAGCDSEAQCESLAEFNAEAIADAMQDKTAASVIDGVSLPTARMLRIAQEAKEAEAKAKADAEQAAAHAKNKADLDAKAKADADAAAAKAAPKDEPKADRDDDKEWADDLIGQAKAATIDDLRVWIKNEGIVNRVRRLKAERPELGNAIEQVFAERLAKK